MYYSIEEPEMQSPEHRSVVFASLGAYYSLIFACLFGWAELFPSNLAHIWMDFLFPVSVSFTILYFGCLYGDIGRLLRIALLSTVSVVIFIGMMAVVMLAIFMLILTMLGISHNAC